MKIKLSWIPFIPITLVVIFAKFIETTLTNGGNFMGLSSFNLVYTAILAVPVMLVFGIFFSIIDRKTSPYYNIKKNIGAAASSFIASIAIIFSSVLSIMNTFSTGKIELLPLVASALGVIAGVVLLLMGTYHLSGKNCNESLSLVMLLPTVWAAVKLIQCFLSYTTVSVVSTDMLDLICYGTIALFLLAVGMVIGNVESKSAVKNCFVFGLPMITALFGYCTKSGINIAMNFQAYDVMEIVNTVGLFAIAVYAIFVLIELTFNANTKDQVELVDRMEEIDEYIQATIREDVEFLYDDQDVVGYEQVEKKPKPKSDFLYTTEIPAVVKEENKDYIIFDEKEPVEPKETPKNVAKFEKVEEVKKAEQVIAEPEAPVKKPVAEKVIKESSFVPAPKPKKTPDDELQSRLDKIDRLILEIQSKQEESDW